MPLSQINSAHPPHLVLFLFTKPSEKQAGESSGKDEPWAHFDALIGQADPAAEMETHQLLPTDTGCWARGTTPLPELLGTQPLAQARGINFAICADF